MLSADGALPHCEALVGVSLTGSASQGLRWPSWPVMTP